MNIEKNIRMEDRMKQEFYAYETYCMIRIEERPDGREILRECRQIALDVERTLNMYDPMSELSIMNRTYQPGQPYPVTGLLFDFIKICIKMAKICKGAFDPTVGRLVKEWNIGSGREKILDSEKLCKLLKKTGHVHVKLIETEKSILIDVPGIIIDPGAAGKGYALDLVAEYLRSKNVQKGCLDFGGNLYVLDVLPGKEKFSDGKNKEERSWRIAVRHPDDPDRIMACVSAKNQAVSTSSWYEHYFVKDGKIYSHLLDPVTGMPVDSGLLSVTVIASKGICADILSTAFYVMGEERGREVLAIMQREGIKINGVIMRADGEIASI